MYVMPTFPERHKPEIPKGIANRHLKITDKCNIAINGKWLRDYLFSKIPKEQPKTAKEETMRLNGRKNKLRKKKDPLRIITEGKENFPHCNI